MTFHGCLARDENQTLSWDRAQCPWSMVSLHVTWYDNEL